MEDKYVQLIEKLAEKLGTTAELLWGVLLKQAPISGFTDLLFILSMILVNAWWIRKVIDGTKEKIIPDWSYPRQEWDKELNWLYYGSVVIILMVSGLMFFSGLAMTIAAFFNPEYWALNQVLKLK